MNVKDENETESPFGSWNTAQGSEPYLVLSVVIVIIKERTQFNEKN